MVYVKRAKVNVEESYDYVSEDSNDDNDDDADWGSRSKKQKKEPRVVPGKFLGNAFLVIRG